jgi:hypothetical protein
LTKSYERWQARLRSARARRTEIEDNVWKPLYEAWIGRMMRFGGEPEPDNRYQQLVDVLLPHLVGNERECVVRVTKINALNEDADQKMQFAEQLGAQATALGRAIGLERDSLGRPGELAKAFKNAMWGMGIVLIGFELRRGWGQAAGSAEDVDPGAPEPVNLDFARAGHSELADAGVPYARCIDPRRFLADATQGDFQDGQWVAIEDYLTVREAKALYPEFADSFQKTHSAAPSWGGGTEDEHNRGQDDGVILFTDVYTRNPRMLFRIPDPRSGCNRIVEAREWDLGFEGLPVVMLGFSWPAGIPYPIPPLASIHDPARFEKELKLTVFGAAGKTRVITLVNEGAFPGLAAQLRKGDDQGVYTVNGDPTGALRVEQAGKIPSEHLELADQAGRGVERNSGISDLMLGRRELGNQTVPEIQFRQGHISNRLANFTDPARNFEAAVYSRLMAAAYSKLDLMHGIQFPLDQSGNMVLAGFDANQPLIGELLDYTFSVYANDAVTNADEVAELNQLLPMLQGMQPVLAQEGMSIRFAPLLQSMLRKSRVQRASEVLVSLPPPPTPGAPGPDGAMGQGVPGPDSSMQAGMPPGMPTPGAPGLDPRVEIAALSQQLQGLPEGDAQEEQITRRLAQLMVGMGPPAQAA